jgi:hypothetical protein
MLDFEQVPPAKTCALGFKVHRSLIVRMSGIGAWLKRFEIVCTSAIAAKSRLLMQLKSVR